jgi:tRNA modification GTPase
MNTNFYGWQDTIAALATPQGMSAIGVIRVSGSHAIEMVNNLFPSKNFLLQPTHTLHVGEFIFNNTAIDEVVVSIFKAPRSFTGENIVEISCHGSSFIQENILRALFSCGARLAKPGEFTQRAFLNGKLDLAQAEAVADIIASNTELSRRNALANIMGCF